MTWKELAIEINLLKPDQQDTDVTVYVRGIDEFYPVSDKLLTTPANEEPDVLDPDHPYLQV